MFVLSVCAVSDIPLHYWLLLGVVNVVEMCYFLYSLFIFYILHWVVIDLFLAFTDCFIIYRTCPILGAFTDHPSCFY